MRRAAQNRSNEKSPRPTLPVPSRCPKLSAVMAAPSFALDASNALKLLKIGRIYKYTPKQQQSTAGIICSARLLPRLRSFNSSRYICSVCSIQCMFCTCVSGETELFYVIAKKASRNFYSTFDLDILNV